MEQSTLTHSNESVGQQTDPSRAAYQSTMAAPGWWGATSRAMVKLSATKANGHAGLCADFIVGIGLVYFGFNSGRVTAAAALATLTCGLLVFSFIEYCFHRWLFHGAPGMVEDGHRKHHEDPLGFDALPFFLPPAAALVLAAVLALPLATGAYSFLFVGALATGYACYGLSHFIMHNTRFRWALPRRWAAAHHIHHFHPEKNFGVTSPLWDILLGTRYVPKRRGQL